MFRAICSGRRAWLGEDGNPIIDPAKNLKTVEQGAATSVWCATSPQLDGMGGVYCQNSDITPLVAEESQPTQLDDGARRDAACSRSGCGRSSLEPERAAYGRRFGLTSSPRSIGLRRLSEMRDGPASCASFVVAAEESSISGVATSPRLRILVRRESGACAGARYRRTRRVLRSGSPDRPGARAHGTRPFWQPFASNAPCTQSHSV